MPSVCFYFQVHQPRRLKFRCWNWAESFSDYFDDQANHEIMLKVARKCYLPSNKKILELIQRHKGQFKVAYAISGICLEQMEEFAPEVIESFQELVNTGCVELISETYYHSLAACFNPEEFKAQVNQHRLILERLFNYQPQVFRNTELIYDNDIGKMVADMGYKAILAEGPDDIMEWRNPNLLYQVPGTDCRLLTKNYRLSDDIAFRFSNRAWADYPLTADKFSDWLHKLYGEQQVVNLFMDYETFGEHQWEDTGIFHFLDHLPEKILQNEYWDFKTPSEVIDSYPVRSELHFNRTTSWADMERDLSAWRGNEMQEKSLKQAFSLASRLKDLGDEEFSNAWRTLLTSDHFYYMCTKWFSDGDVHAYFSPFDSPYDAFVAYANIFGHFQERLERREEELRTKAELSIEVEFSSNKSTIEVIVPERGLPKPAKRTIK